MESPKHKLLMRPIAPSPFWEKDTFFTIARAAVVKSRANFDLPAGGSGYILRTAKRIVRINTLCHSSIADYLQNSANTSQRQPSVTRTAHELLHVPVRYQQGLSSTSCLKAVHIADMIALTAAENVRHCTIFVASQAMP